MPLELLVFLVGSVLLLATSWLSRYFFLWRGKTVRATQLLGVISIVFLMVFGLLITVGRSIGIALLFSGLNTAIIMTYFILQRRTLPEQLAKSERRKTIFIFIVGFMMFSVLYWIEGVNEALIATSFYGLLVIFYILLRSKSRKLR